MAGKYQVYGLTGVYNATPLVLDDGQGVALAVTQNGYTIVVNADGSSIGGGTEYIDGGIPPAHPHGATIEWSDGANWQTVSTAKPLPVSATFTPSGTQDVNLTKVGGASFALGQQVAAAALPVVLTAAQISTLTPLGTVAVTQATSPWVVSGAVTEASLDAALISQETTTSGIKGLTVFGAVTTNAPSYTNAKSDALSLDTSGLLRISLKDTPANTNKLLVTPDSVALPANQSVNVSQMNGATTAMGSGIMGTGVQRVAIASDNDPLTVKQATGTNLHVVVDSAPSTAVTNAGTFAVQATPVTQADTFMLGGVNIKEINAVTPLMGNGVTGTGSLRVTIASDNTAFAVDTELPAAATIAADTVTPTVPGVASYLFIRTGGAATWDRLTGMGHGTNSAGAGLVSAGMLGEFDDASPTSITENQFGNIRMSANRNQYQTIRDAAGNERGVNVTAANELNVLPTQKDTFAAAAAFTITLASLANSTAGVGRQSTLVTSNTAKSALIMVKFTVGTTPVANSLIYVYLIRGDGSINDDNAGASDAGLTVINAPLLGTILCSAATSNTAYYGMFDTKFLGSLGPTFGIAVVNSTNVTANSTGGNFTAEYTLIT